MLPPEPFAREYFDWSEEVFAKRFVERISGGRLRQSDSYVDLKIRKTTSVQKVKTVYKDLVNLPSLIKMLPALAQARRPATI